MNNKKTGLLFIAFIFMFASANASILWISNVDGVWSDPSNWSPATVPVPSDVVQFDGGGTGKCTLDGDVTIFGFNSWGGYTSEIDLNGHNLSIIGSNGNTIKFITFNDGIGTGELLMNPNTPGAGGMVIGDCIFGAKTKIYPHGWLQIFNSTFNSEAYIDISVISPFKDNIFNGETIIEVTTSPGGDSVDNTFNGNVTFINSDNDYYSVDNIIINTFKANVTLKNNGTGHLYFANQGVGHHIEGDLIMVNSASGSEGQLNICASAGSACIIDGDVKITNNGSATTLTSQLNGGGNITVLGDLEIINSGIGDASTISICNNAGTVTSIVGKTTVTNNGTATTSNKVELGKEGTVTFTDDVKLINNLGSHDSRIVCSSSGSNNSHVFFNGNVIITSTSNRATTFGSINGGTVVLATDKTISTNNFSAGTLRIVNFTQASGTVESYILLSGSSRMDCSSSTWNGNVHITAPTFSIITSTFNGTTVLEKTGVALLNLNVANVYDDISFINSSTSGYIVDVVGTNTYNGTIDLKTTNTGSLWFTHNGSSPITENFTASSSSVANTTIRVQSDQPDGLKIEKDANFTSSGGGKLSVELGGVPGNFSSLDIDGNINIGSDVLFDVRNSSKITVTGNFSNAGVFTIKSEGDGDADGFGDGDGSLITKGSITNTGNTIVERWTDPSKTWQLVSSPISDGLSGVFLGHYLNEYIITEGDFKAIRPTNISLGIGDGYVTKRAGLLGTNAPNPFLFQGTINGGTTALSPKVTLSEDASGLADTDREFYSLNVKFNLIGNPYPSCLDWDDLYLANSAIVDASYYRYNDAGDGNGSWVPNLASDPNQSIINIGQGFGVIWKGAASDFTFSNDARTHEKGTGFSKKSSITSDRFDLIASSNGLSDNVNFRFNDNATYNYDGLYDAYKFDSFGDTPTPSFISFDDRNLAICQQPKSESVDLGFKMAVSGEVTFSLSNVRDFSEILLEDKETGDFVDLTKTTYTFTYSDSDEEIGRFTLHFKQETLSDVEELDGLNIYSSNSSLYIKSEIRLSNVNVSIYNVSGQTVLTRYFEGIRDEEIKTELKGVYVLKLTSDKGAYTSKLILN